MSKRSLAPMLILALGLLLGSCSSMSGFVADHWPHWAGGMPNDVPPRPGAPGYEEFIAHKGTSKDTTAATGKTGATAGPSGNPARNDQDAVAGGLY